MSTLRRPPLLLYSYIAAEMLAPLFASLLILYATFLLVRLIPLLEIVLDLRIGFADFIRLFAYITPHIVLYSIPMATMMGIIIGWTRLANDREILALKACGVSLRQMLPPVVLISLMVALLTGVFSLKLIPASQLAMKQLLFQLAKEKIDKGLEERQFTETLGDLVVYIDAVDAETKKWQGVYVSDMRGQQRPVITMARSGSLQADVENMQVVIVLHDGSLHRTDISDSQVIDFARYQLQIPLRPPTVVDGEDVTTLSKGSMSQQQLLEAAYQHGVDTHHGAVYHVEYHHRLSLPFGCFVLGLLGVPLGLQAGPGRKAAGIPLGLAFFVLYYLAGTTGKLMGVERTLPALPAIWLPNILFFLLTLTILHRVNREKGILPDWLNNYLTMLSDRFLRPLWEGLRTHVLVWFRSKRQAIRSNQWHMPVHANTASGLYHLPGCPHFRDEHTLEFKNVKLARQAGFQPCEQCHPRKQP
ncbi:MAG: permease [Desulfobulbaceae bacterium A2]|nr:MAG: permease [Desulfobulbaceae bacterium A2]